MIAPPQLEVEPREQPVSRSWSEQISQRFKELCARAQSAWSALNSGNKQQAATFGDYREIAAQDVEEIGFHYRDRSPSSGWSSLGTRKNSYLSTSGPICEPQHHQDVEDLTIWLHSR
jgi:hypothetical protein